MGVSRGQWCWWALGAASAVPMLAERAAQVALGIDQEVAALDDAVAVLQAGLHFDERLAAHAELHFARREAARALLDQRDLACAGVDHGGVRDR